MFVGWDYAGELWLGNIVEPMQYFANIDIHQMANVGRITNEIINKVTFGATRHFIPVSNCGMTLLYMKCNEKTL